MLYTCVQLGSMYIVSHSYILIEHLAAALNDITLAGLLVEIAEAVEPW